MIGTTGRAAATILAALAPVLASAQCTPLLSSATGLATAGTVNLVYTGSSPLVSQGASMWNNTCGPELPDFVVRSQGVAGGINININVVNGTPSACQVNQCGCTDRITQSGILTGGTVHIDSSCGKETVAHELGHLLGLADTTHSSCVTRIMYFQNVPAGLATVETGDCAAVDGLWETPSEATPTENGGGGQTPPAGDPGNGEGSPILVDLDRNFFHLTGLGDPVLFDIDADGDLEVLSWTAAGQLDAFLWLDRNGNGTVDTGAELFGNYTPLIDGTTAANGYLALAEFDLPAMGGNDNRRIDAGDVIYPELRLWIDDNHNGASEPEEILTLAEAGVTRIVLLYLTTRVHDQHGNYFRYVSAARIVVGGSERPTWTTDVFFAVSE
jgi:hypothetical protein